MLRVALGGLLIACADGTTPAGEHVVDEHEGFRVLALAQSPETPSSTGSLDIRVEAIGGWHIAPEAPLRLDLQSAEIRLMPAELRREQARSISEEGFDFRAEVRAERAGPTTAHGQLKFGICRAREDKCIIMRREFEVPVEIAFGPGE